MLVALAVAIAGLAGVFSRDSMIAPSFVEDQFGSRFTLAPAVVLAQAGNYAGSVLKHFFTWIVLLVIAAIIDRDAFARAWRAHARSSVIAIAWLALLLVVFSLSNTHRGRYLTPAHPLLACAIGAWLAAAMESERAGRWVRGFAKGATAVFALALACVALLSARIDAVVAASIAVCASFAAIAYVRTRRARDARPLVALALCYGVIWSLGAEAARALVAPSPVPRLAARLSAAHLDASSRIATIGFMEADEVPSNASQIRIASHGTLEPFEAVLDDDARWRDAHAVVASELARSLVEAEGFRLEPCGYVVPSLTARATWDYLTSPEPKTWLEHHGHTVWIGWR
jgi:hypothetical protein